MTANRTPTAPMWLDLGLDSEPSAHDPLANLTFQKHPIHLRLFEMRNSKPALIKIDSTFLSTSVLK